jgi:uncharacterized protein YegJ (DUF2314 family)
MIRYCTIFLLISTLQACHTKTNKSSPVGGALEIYSIDVGDEEMNNAIAEARTSFKQFNDAFKSNRSDYSLFALKVMFQDHVGGYEHIWITDLSFRDGEYHGTVGNTPSYTTEVEAGQQITVEAKKISDWMYVEHGKLRGGFTLRVLRNRMSQSERDKFDADLGFKIKD